MKKKGYMFCHALQWGVHKTQITGETIMKKIALLIGAAALILTLTGCTSLRTPSTGANNNKVWYNTIFGVSIESAVYGDGILVK